MRYIYIAIIALAVAIIAIFNPDCPLERARIGQPRASGFASARRANNRVYWRGARAERGRPQAPSRRVGRCDKRKCSSYDRCLV
jgi:hypothetical protein